MDDFNFEDLEKPLKILGFFALVIFLGLILSSIFPTMLQETGLDKRYYSLVSTVITALLGIIIYEIARKKKLI